MLNMQLICQNLTILFCSVIYAAKRGYRQRFINIQMYNIMSTTIQISKMSK
jgi:hypothetical protein